MSTAMPPVVSDSTDVSLQMASLSLGGLPKRPGVGSLGKKIEALSNHFPITFRNNQGCLWEYAIQMKTKGKDDDKIGPRIRRRVAFLLLEQHPEFQQAGTDYSRMVISTRQLLKDERFSRIFSVDYYEEEESGPRQGNDKRVYEVTVALSKVFKTADLVHYARNQSCTYDDLGGHLMALNILLNRIIGQNLSFTSTARREKFFDIGASNGRAMLGYGLQVYMGFFKSCRITTSGLTLLLNTAASAMFQNCTVSTLITEMSQGIRFQSKEAQLRYLEYQMRKVRVETTYTGQARRFTFYRLARAMTPGDAPTVDTVTVRGINSNDIPVTVRKWFSAKFPEATQPSSDTLVIDVGFDSKPNLIPAHLCTIVSGCPYKRLLPRPQQTSQMIKVACRPPRRNKELITSTGLNQMQIGMHGGPGDIFGIDIARQMLRIQARSLPKPNFSYQSGSSSDVASGRWNMNGKVFTIPPKEGDMQFSWLELVPLGNRPAYDNGPFIQSMQSALRANTNHRKATITTFSQFDHKIVIPENGNQNWLQPKWTVFNEKGVRLVFVILPSTSANLYRAVKLSADTYGQGIHTICTVREHDGKLNTSPSKCANEVLKVNAKLGGVNLKWMIPQHLRSLGGRKIMFVGADVVHPGPCAMKEAPSVAAVVASTDPYYFQYAGSYRLQQPDTNKKALEYIQDFGDMCEERLWHYFKINKCPPDLIVVYRDGVADNMFAEVVTEEVQQLFRACRKLYKKTPLPDIIVMVCQKRGMTRFFQPPDVRDPTVWDRNENPLPGFVADQGVTSGSAYDFFLVSHICLKGTSRPAHYTVLHNDSKLSIDEIQNMTYHMCFLWPRATQSIGIHPAARAADAMCDRAKVYLNDVYSLPPERLGRDKPTYVRNNHWQGEIGPNLKDSMFFL